MKKFLVISFVILMFVVAFTEDVIKIGAYFPMTGGIAAFGQMTWQGIQLANEERPTVLGKKIQLILVDNKGDKVESANAVSRLIDQEHVVAILGAVASSDSLAGGAVAEAKRIPMVTSSSTNPLVTMNKDWIFRSCFIDPFQGLVGAKFAFNDLKAKKVVIFMDIAQDYCVGLANYFEKTFKGYKGTSVVREYYNTGDQDFSAQIINAMDQNPDLIYIPGYYSEIAIIARQLQDMGYTGKILAGDGAEAPELIKIGGDAVEGLYFTTHYNAEGPATPKAREYVKAYKTKYNKIPDSLGALGYDAYNMVIDAIEKAGSATPRNIRNALATLKSFEGVTGYITIKDGNAIKSAVIDQVKDGDFKFIKIINP
ncbi:branched-chain amino acid ABC transporter substrate-binding protein [Tepiditoga spiralis]|uniref:Branched-chain amino acid ABC transporter substrate-binding protein n=1 Tax=Tepiditoga spiralis TaxID=2108365 RepID=A0A7G1G487_9BACT|nr:ABC transporter substrate-binding protein [Tepiditoga spiralis]BBE31161.1 branched-chain amino acid ABC transporter substrate-binding protein [Tepiditoga spiralis]